MGMQFDKQIDPPIPEAQAAILAEGGRGVLELSSALRIPPHKFGQRVPRSAEVAKVANKQTDGGRLQI